MVVKRVLIVDDEENILAALRGVLEDEGFEIETAKSGAAAFQKMRNFQPDVILLDIWMPGEDGLSLLPKFRQLENPSIVMMSGHGTIETAVKAIKLGAFDFLEKPLHFDKVLLLLQHVFELRELKRENKLLREELQEEDSLIGDSGAMVKLRSLVTAAAPSNGWVLIQGENGTGKELVARALHHGSPRSRERFVAVNCAAIPDDLIESELFGHEKGAFTGASDRKIGKFELADGGTLFLDEVGDMGLKMQAKILRALQECVVYRLGGQEAIALDLRVIAATNKDLRRNIKTGEFREDLFYRLNVIPIHVPPLRLRKEDIPKLLDHFIRLFSGGRLRRVDETTLRMLMEYPWPGNVRELKNWTERACILSQSDVISSAEFDGGEASTEPEGDDADADALSLDEKTLRSARSAFEKRFILKMLAENGGNVTKTAQMIGLERSHLHKKMKSYGIEAPL